MCAVARILLGAAFASAIVAFVAFESFSIPSVSEVRQVSAAVVFTGNWERVDAGLQLVQARIVPLLYISGVNAKSLMSSDHFIEQFSARNPNISDLRQLVECCVELGERAENTLQNAMDTKCWVDRRGLTGPLLLITSRRHMARSLAALSGILPRRRIVPYPVIDGDSISRQERLRVLEYLKYLATVVVVRLPWTVGARRLYGQFAEGCFEQ